MNFIIRRRHTAPGPTIRSGGLRLAFLRLGLRSANRLFPASATESRARSCVSPQSDKFPSVPDSTPAGAFASANKALRDADKCEWCLLK